jgi:hypothetical protein
VKKTVFLIGTDHRYQTRSADFTDAQHDAFADFVAERCSALAIVGIAEEHSNEALAESCASQPVLCNIANFLRLRHRYCDPNRQLRSQLGIKQENDIRAFGSNLSEAEVRDRVQASHRKREQHWLEQLLEFDVWPVLYVCGANHSARLHSLLDQHSIHTELVASDWGAL